MLKPQYAFLILFAALLITGCTGSKEAAMEKAPHPMEKAPHPLAGTWDWSDNGPKTITRNLFNGILTFAEVDDMLSGTITTGFRTMAAGEPAPLQELTFDSEMSKVTFNFDSGIWGIMNVTLTLDGDTLSGIIKNEPDMVESPMSCSRKTME